MCKGDFNARLGRADAPGLLSQDARLAQIQPGQNPYVPGGALPGNSPVFVGRATVLHQILAILRKLGKPGNVSLLGERRIGKSSLLNQVFAALGQEPGLVAIQANALDWNDNSQQSFHQGLHRAIAEALGLANVADVADYPSLRNFIAQLARDGYRFVLIIDEFEKMAGNPHFDTNFFHNLRTLADLPEYRFAFLLSSRRPLEELCRDHNKIDASSFWNIFGTKPVLGLLSEQEAERLAVEPFALALGPERRTAAETVWRDKVKHLTGWHPALIQIAMSQHFNAAEGGYTVEPLDIQMTLRDYLEDFWYGRRREELEVLLLCAAKDTPKPSGHVYFDLMQRGLLAADGKLFCAFFEKIIAESLPKGKSFSDAAQELGKDPAAIEKFFDQLLTWGERVGKVYSTFKGGAKEDKK